MARKAAFVNDMILQTLNQGQQVTSPVVKVVAKLDDEISDLLKNNKLDQYDKAKLYSQILQKYLSTRENINPVTQPAPVVPAQPDMKTYSDSAIMDTVPGKFGKQARNLLRHIHSAENLKWNDDGQVLVDDQPIRGSNIVDLFNDVLRRRKTSQPKGWREFALTLQKLNIPSDLIGNPDRKGELAPPEHLVSIRNRTATRKKHMTKRRKNTAIRWTST